MTTATTVPDLQLSPRVTVRPGDTVSVMRGSGPTWSGDAGDAINLRSGCTHTLYLSGPAHRSRTLQSITNRPYRIRRLRKPR